MSEPDATWCGHGVSVQEGYVDMTKWGFSDQFPWLCDGKDKLEIVVSDWDMVDGEWDYVQVGINFDDLLDEMFNLEDYEDTNDSDERRANVIAALERAITKLKTEPLHTKPRTNPDATTQV